MEPLLAQLSDDRHPAGVVFDLRCMNRHPLLWLVSTRWGLVPVVRRSEEPKDEMADITGSPWSAALGVTRTSDRPAPGRFEQSFSVERLDDGALRTLADWEPDRPLFVASCACHAEVQLFVPHIKRAMTARRSATYRADGSIV